MSHANASHNHEQMVIDHLRARVATLKGAEHNAHAEISYRDAETHAEYQMEISAEKTKVSRLQFEAKILKRGYGMTRNYS